MNDEAEPFGGCDILEPDHDTKGGNGMGGPSKVTRDDHEVPVQESSVSSTSTTPLVRIVKKTQMYIEPHGFSKTVTIDEDHTRKAHSMQSQPSSSSWAQENGDDRGSGTRQLTRLTLRIGKKQMTFKVTDIPPQNQEYSADWDWANQVRQAEAAVFYPSKRHCVSCNRVFNTIEELRRHIAETHSFRAFSCTYCSRSFSTKGEYMAHTRDHSNDRPHECLMCNKRFRTANNLNQHMKLHATGSRHFCNMCGKCFRTNDELASHHTRCLALSEGEGSSTGGGAIGPDGRLMRYECSYCGKPFQYRRDKAIHERVHNGERPYECGYCGRAFTQSQALTSHIRVHTGEKPYSCQHCNGKFRDSSALRKHETNHFCSPTRLNEMKGKMMDEGREGSYEEDDEEEDGVRVRYQDESRVHLISQMEMGDGEMEEVEEEIVEEGEIPPEDDYYM